MKGVFVRLDQLIRQIERDQTQERHERLDEILSINFFNSNTASDGQSFQELNAEFLHWQLLISCLIRMKPATDERYELLSTCREAYQNNSSELRIVKQFEREYSPNKALWWYTRPSFLYRMLNKAFRVQNIDLLYRFRFVIRDIKCELERNKCSRLVRVYRAQLMSKEEIQMLKSRMKQFMSINSFLSTSLDPDLARFCLTDSTYADDLERVFFQIDADPQLPNVKPFSDLTQFSHLPLEEEVLFMAGSIFRLHDIHLDQDGIWNIRMSLCSDNDYHLQPLFRHLNDKLGNSETTLLDFGHLLKDMGRIDNAQIYYLRHLCQLPNYHQRSSACCHALGMIAGLKGDFESSLRWYNKSLEIAQHTLTNPHPNIAFIHNSLGEIYRKKGDYPQALAFFQTALGILKVFGKDDPHTAACYNNIGLVHKDIQKYSKALKWYIKAAQIREKCLPKNHHDLGQSYNNIGTVYRCLGRDDLALNYLTKSLAIKLKSLPGQHSDVASTLANIGLVYEQNQEFQHALSYYRRAMVIYLHSFRSGHPNVKKIERIISRVRLKLK